MTFTEFMSLLNGEYKETAGTDAKNQCVDLVNAYIRYVLGLPPIEWTNAVDFPSKAGDKYDYILNTPTGVPTEGDLVIWGGTYGHIAIFIEGNAKRFTSFDENYPTGSPCHVQEHTYLSPKVIGWLHPKTAPVTDTADWKAKYEEKVKLETFLRGEIQKKDDTITNLNNQISQLEKDKNLLADELKVCQQTIQEHEGCQTKILEALALKNQAEQNYAKAKGDWQIKEIAYNKQIVLLTTKYQATKSSLKKLLIDYIFGKK